MRMSYLGSERTAIPSICRPLAPARRGLLVGVSHCSGLGAQNWKPWVSASDKTLSVLPQVDRSWPTLPAPPDQFNFVLKSASRIACEGTAGRSLRKVCISSAVTSSVTPVLSLAEDTHISEPDSLCLSRTQTPMGFALRRKHVYTSGLKRTPFPRHCRSSSRYWTSSRSPA